MKSIKFSYRKIAFRYRSSVLRFVICWCHLDVFLFLTQDFLFISSLRKSLPTAMCAFVWLIDISETFVSRGHQGRCSFSHFPAKNTRNVPAFLGHLIKAPPLDLLSLSCRHKVHEEFIIHVQSALPASIHQDIFCFLGIKHLEGLWLDSVN